jgi:putative transposase
LSIGRQCELLGLCRSGFYYTPADESPENLCLMNAIDKLHTRHPYYGVERIKVHLPEAFQPVNAKRIRRLMHLMGIQTLYQRPNLSKPDKGHEIYPYLLRGLNIDRPMQVLAMDITYIPMASGFLYLCAVQDWFSRYVTAWRLSNTLSVAFCKEAVEETLDIYGCPEIFNTDQGSQFTSSTFLGLLKKNEIQISMDGRGRALDNVFVERLWRTVKYEHVYLYAYENGLDLFNGLSQFFPYYNAERKHQSLNYQTPEKLFSLKN